MRRAPSRPFLGGGRAPAVGELSFASFPSARPRGRARAMSRSAQLTCPGRTAARSCAEPGPFQTPVPRTVPGLRCTTARKRATYCSAPGTRGFIRGVGWAKRSVPTRALRQTDGPRVGTALRAFARGHGVARLCAWARRCTPLRVGTALHAFARGHGIARLCPPHANSNQHGGDVACIDVAVSPGAP
jgi:hypothetical protein